MRSITVLGLGLALLAGPVLAQTSDLMISEYVEGSGDNQAIEIYNGTADVVSASDYQPRRNWNFNPGRIRLPESSDRPT